MFSPTPPTTKNVKGMMQWIADAKLTIERLSWQPIDTLYDPRLRPITLDPLLVSTPSSESLLFYGHNEGNVCLLRDMPGDTVLLDRVNDLDIYKTWIAPIYSFGKFDECFTVLDDFHPDFWFPWPDAPIRE